METIEDYMKKKVARVQAALDENIARNLALFGESDELDNFISRANGDLPLYEGLVYALITPVVQ